MPRPQRSSDRISTQRRFLITGFDPETKLRQAVIIKRLGGICMEDRCFKDTCTHLICEQPNRSEKFLGACACGKWILKSSYLKACDNANAWLDEKEFEWDDSNVDSNIKNPFVYRAPKRWRSYVSQTNKRAFDGWRVVLLIDDVNMKTVFRRLLEAGGALAVILKLPPTVDRNITHIFVKSALSHEYLKPWRDENVPCLAPDYIGDYLIEDQIPPLCSRDIFMKEKIELKKRDSEWSITPVDGSQSSDPARQSSCPSRSISLSNTPCKLPDSENVSMQKKLMVKLHRLENSPCRNEKPDDNNNICNESIVTRYNLRNSRATEASVSVGTTNEGEVSETVYGSSPNTALKRRTDSKSDQPTKRIRYEDMLMTLDQRHSLRHQTSTSVTVPVSLSAEEIFNTCHEEGYYVQSLEEFSRYLTTCRFITPHMLNKIMYILTPDAVCTDSQLSVQVYKCLKRFLSLHPPTNQTLQTCYYESMQFDSSPWEFLISVIDVCKEGQSEESGSSSENGFLLLEYMSAMFCVNRMYGETKVPLIAQLLWTRSDTGDVNYRVRHLFNLALDTTTQNANMRLRKLLYSLLISAFSAVQITCKESFLNCGKSQRFITELTNQLLPATNDIQFVENLFECLGDSLLCVGVAAAILDTWDNIVVDKYTEISVGKILCHYLYCIPRRTNVERPVKTKAVTPLNNTTIKNVNKRNPKGETKLHRACMKGDFTMVSRLLSVPGIDVNIQDFAGWTALHEACNHGNLDCVKLLLNYKAPKTLVNYFSPGVRSSRGVNLYLVDGEGTSVLHDSVQSNRLEVVRLLVKLGDDKLLNMVNAEGQTALDLAESDEMREALTPDNDSGLSQSQTDYSLVSSQSEDLYMDFMNTASIAECRRFLILFQYLLVSYIQVKDLRPEKVQSDDENWTYLSRFPRYVDKLRRHIRRIVVEEGQNLTAFQDIFDRFYLLADSYV